MEKFHAFCNKSKIKFCERTIEFVDRIVILVFAKKSVLSLALYCIDELAELRRAKETPSVFMKMNNREQKEWSDDLLQRLEHRKNGIKLPRICILDTGVSFNHPLIKPFVQSDEDFQTVEAHWEILDRNGHGTEMAGLILYKDLSHVLANNLPIQRHCDLEGIKILPNQGENDPDLYGEITKQAVSLIEIKSPDSKRAFCMAVTADGVDQGKPSSWSAAIDHQCFNDGHDTRLFIVSCGNIRPQRSKITAADYVDENLLESIQDPAQSWNTITVGAYTEKIYFSESERLPKEWIPIATNGDLSPSSTTSTLWESQWPNKPDIVCEGGNAIFSSNASSV